MLDREYILQSRANVPDHVIFQTVEDSIVLLNLDTELYFGLDEIGAAMWNSIEARKEIPVALESLVQAFDAPADQIADDLAALVAELVANGLLELEA